MTTEDFFESIAQQFNEELPFVAYRKPNGLTIKAMLQNDDALFKIKDFSKSGFVFAPFDDNEDAILFPSDTSKLISIRNIISSAVEKTHPLDDLREIDEKIAVFAEITESKQNHCNLVQKGIDAINKGQFQKVVLSRNESVSLIDANPISIFKKLLNTYNSAFVYIWYHPRVGLWLGATPETLLKIKSNRFSTMALAGTKQYKGTLDVNWDDKNKEEQQYVKNFIVENLKRITNDLNISEVKTIKAGSLLHLKSDISGSLKQDSNNIKRLIKKLHPTPAVCGLPKETTKQFILSNEKYNREFYTGYLGELNLKEKQDLTSNSKNIENKAYATVNTVTNLYVNLRCMQLKKKEAILYIGGGITKDSIPESEWEETLNKAEIIKRVL